ncbi:hypothetical protein CTZ27_22365 [Streptomyces griseocarneus]|nr:hypothetical protein CTZ27_22365 [Streptomyces griseocarneus]
MDRPKVVGTVELPVVAGVDGSMAGRYGRWKVKGGPGRIAVELTGGGGDGGLACLAFALAALRGCEVEAFFPWFGIETWNSGAPRPVTGPAADGLSRAHRIDNALRRAMDAHPEVPLLAHPIDGPGRTAFRKRRSIRGPARRP